MFYILFLLYWSCTHGETVKHLITKISGTAVSEGFLGIDTLDRDVYQFSETIKKCHDAGILFVCYGDDVGDNLQLMQDSKVDMAIYDRLVFNK